MRVYQFVTGTLYKKGVSPSRGDRSPIVKQRMATKDAIKIPDFIANPVTAGREDRYETVMIDVPKVLKSWQMSLFSYEWMLPDGRIKDVGELPEKEQPKRAEIEDKISSGTPLEMPILGIGLMDNIEIGSGRATFLTLAAHGVRAMPVHIPKSNQSEFKAFIVKT